MRTLTRDEYFPNPNSAISIVPESPQAPLPEHAHEFDELVIVRSGSCIHFHDGKPMPISRGSVMYIRAKQAHFLDQLDDVYLTNVLILPHCFKHIRHETVVNLLERSSGIEGNSYMINGVTLKRVESLLNRLSDEAGRRVEYSEQMIELLISQLMIELWRGQPEENIEAHDDRDARLTMLLRHLNNHFEDEADWDVLASRFKISQRTLSRRILDVTGLSPNKYLMRIRICAAMRLLKETTKSVTDIAFSCGFNDSNYFTYRFHQETGMTPMKYRGCVELAIPLSLKWALDTNE